MIRFSLRGTVLAAIALPVLLAACNGSGGDAPSDPPANVAVTAGDTSVTVTWTAEPGLTYWIFSAAAPSITRDNYNQFPGARIIQPATSPQLIAGLANGTTYSFIVNATRDGGPAGPASASVAAVPRLAGATWTVGSTLGADLNAVAFGLSRYVAVGAGGALFTSTTAESGSWTAGATGSAVSLNGVAGNVSTIVAVGDAGTILTSADAAAFASISPAPTAVRLNDVVLAPGTFVAVGDGGTVLRSADAVTWTAVASGTTEDLHGVSVVGGLVLALGANGTLLASTDAGESWTPRISGTTATLRSAAIGGNLLVAVGDAGTWLSSLDGVTWTVQSPFTAANLRRIVSGSQFVTVGDGGAVFVSQDGMAWTAGSSGTSADLRGLLRGVVLNYVAVGTGGANLSAR